MRLPCGCVGCEEEKVSCETFESPSMMWKRSIVQAVAARAQAAPARAHLRRARLPLLQPLLLLLLLLAGGAWSADLVIEIPGSGGSAADPGGEYRLDYRPPHGSPAPNFTVPARASTINFQGLPGTKYHFMLYYSNATFADLLTWNQTIITAPEPPTNLTVSLSRNKQATIAWAPPSHGDYTGFRFKVIPLTERAEGGARNITVEAPEAPGAGWSHTLKELSPGATYQLHAFTLLHDKESAAYASRNFTTKPNTPGKFIVWFRNETTLLVLWQPPYPPGAYTHYKVSIVPPDARESELYVEKEGEPPGPAQAAFKGLVPGRPYNISVQTVSEPEISAPTTAQYRTVPLRPRDVQLPARYITPTSFRVTWLPPKEESEFEKYQVSVSGGGGAARRLTPVLRARNETPAVTFEGLEPGAHYTVTVKTMSGKVTSWPAPAEITLKPLPVRDLQWRYQNETEGGGILVWWQPAEGSTQDEYKVSYHEAHGSGDSSTLSTTATNATLDTGALLPGRNYTVAVLAVSRGVDSAEAAFSAPTRPLAPVVRAWGGAARQLTLAWSSDVNSRQDRYELRHRRRPETGADLTDPEYTFQTLMTTGTNATLTGLFPGAVYEVTVAAMSHGLRSERHTVFKPVRPLPPTWMGVERATSNSVVVRWRGPGPGSRLGAFLLQYRTHSEQKWTRLPPLQPDITEAEVVDMTHGERYTIQLDTLSEAVAGGDSVDSGEPLKADHTVRPNPVSNVAALVDTRNMTLEWPVPAGRVELYALRWWARADEAPDAAPAARNLTAEPAARTVRALLDALEPGVGYTLTVHAVSYNLTSDLFTMETRTRPLIQSEMTIVNEPEGDSAGNDTLPAIRVLYTLTPATASRFDSYRFRLEGGPGEAQEQTRAAAAPAARVEFARLVPGRLYNVTMWTVSGNVTSHPVQRPTRLYPRAVAYLNYTEVGARTVTLVWPEPAGDYTDFELQYLAAEDRLEARSTPNTAYTVQDLQPYTTYTFTLEVRSGTPTTLPTRSPGLSVSVRTREAPPPAPRAFHPTDAKPSQLTFSWELPPDRANGVLDKFVIEYSPQGQPDKNTTITFPPEARSGVVAGLTPGGTYSFRLWAETGAGAGPAARWTQHLAIAAPPRPAPHALPAAVRATPTTVSVRFRNDYFSAANGNVSAYALVVAQEPRNDSSDRLPSWRDVHRLPVWPPYQVTEPYFPFHHSAVEEYTIGSERCESSGRAYCNGPLRPGAAYYVKLRAYTAPDKFTDTAYAVVYTAGSVALGSTGTNRR